MAPFYGWGSTASRLEPLRGGSLLFTTKFPEIPGTHFIDLGRCLEVTHKKPSNPCKHEKQILKNKYDDDDIHVLNIFVELTF